MGMAPNWKPEQIEYLQEHWGSVSISHMAKKLGRSENAVVQKAGKLGLGAFLDSGEYVSFNQLIKVITGNQASYSYQQISWVKNKAFPIHRRKVRNNSFKVVYLDEFWQWAEKNRNFLDFSRFPEGALGMEPAWVKEQRKIHGIRNVCVDVTPWTAAEDERLISLLKQHRFTYLELSKMLRRTCGAIQRRCCDLNIPERPVKAANNIKWTQSEFAQLAECINAGMNYELISNILGKSSKAIRGKVYAVYYTEQIDQVRKMLNGGSWGNSAPVPKVKQAFRHQKGVRDNLATLAGLLSLRRNELGWSPYWQKDMCMNWDSIKGCLKSQSNCDECTEFQRIRPQNCARCGATFMERTSNRFCPACRSARIKQAQRKWAALGKQQKYSSARGEEPESA